MYVCTCMILLIFLKIGKNVQWYCLLFEIVIQIKFSETIQLIFRHCDFTAYKKKKKEKKEEFNNK